MKLYAVPISLSFEYQVSLALVIAVAFYDHLGLKTTKMKIIILGSRRLALRKASYSKLWADFVCVCICVCVQALYF